MILKTLVISLTIIINSFCIKFYLNSSEPDGSQGQQVQIPLLHQHPFSCELVFFLVHNNIFSINVTGLPNRTKLVKINITMRQEFIYYHEKQASPTNWAYFQVDLKPKNETKSYQAIMNFNLTYQVYSDQGFINQNELRKSYMLFCESGKSRFILKMPILTLAITQAIGSIIILIIPWNIQYRKFLPFNYNIFTCIIQILILSTAYYLQNFFGTSNIVFEIQRFFVGILQLILLVIYSQDFVMIVIQRTWLSFLISSVFSIIIIGLDYFVPEVQDAWFLNNIIAIMVAGACIKFLIIRKIKSALGGLIIMWLFCLFRQFIKQIGVQKFDQGLGIRVVPLYLQLPTYWQSSQSSLTCSSFSCGKMIAFGLILNFCKRLDLYLSTQFYRILLSALALICIACELIFNIVFQDLPSVQLMGIILFYPLGVSLMLFFANKRGQWAQVWYGSFYDMAVNRASISRRVSFKQLESDFGKDLLVSQITNSQ